MLHNTNRCSYSYMIQCIRTRVQNIRILENGICFAKKIWLYMYTVQSPRKFDGSRIARELF